MTETVNRWLEMLLGPKRPTAPARLTEEQKREVWERFCELMAATAPKTAREPWTIAPGVIENVPPQE